MLVRVKNYSEGFIRNIHKKDQVVNPICSHFTLCGGCRWQHMDYQTQLSIKEKQVADNIERIGGGS